MTTCRECRDQLSAYREGELADPLRKELDAHLAGCAECRAQLAGLEQMIRQMKGLPPVPVPADFRSRVWQKIEKESGFQRLRRAILEPWYLKLPVEALATAVVVLIVAQVVRVAGPEKMAMVPPAPAELANRADVSPMEIREKVALKAASGITAPQAFRKQEASLEEARDEVAGEMPQAKLMDAAAGSVSSSLRMPLLLFRLYMSDPAAGRDSVRLFVTEKLNGDFLETEIPNTLFFRISADRLDELRDGLFEFGSFEQASESEPREGSVSVSLEILPERDS